MEKNEQRKRYIIIACMIIKYIFPIILACLAYMTVRSRGYFIFAVSDVLIIMSLTNILLKRSRHFYWLNSVLIFFVNLELGVLYFSGSTVTLVMIQSLNSVRVLAGNAVSYLCGAAAVVVFSFLPVTEIKPRKKKMNGAVFAAALAFQLALIVVSGTNYSTWKSVYNIYEQQKIIRELSNAPENTVEAAESDETAESMIDAEFYKNEVADYYSKPEVLPEEPNIILIFTEGLSQNIIDDERGIMPNAAELQGQSITFKNYYNHTFATYRGLQGQLFSGYQLNDLDTNNLISIQDILSDKGYYTAFINTESENDTFSDYLARLDFDDVLADAEKKSGLGDTQSDKEAYEVLLDNALELEGKEEPFFLAMYTVGTHVSFDSTDEMFEEGTFNVLNRFYNADYQFGEFFEQFKGSELASDTILIFTSDHATFAEADFQEAFPDYERICTALDAIPLSIYYEGIEAEYIDVEGRNSLDLAPTILDFIDVSGSNYFMGESLFMPKSEEISCDTVFFDPDCWLTTDGGSISELSEEQAEYLVPKVKRYFSLI